MSRLATGIIGFIALSLTVGAAQFASGRDLPEAAQDRLQKAFQEPLVATAAAGAAAAINRAAKADRAAGVAGSPAQTRTISLRLNGFADTSFLVRVPVAHSADDALSVPSAIKPGGRKMMLACEPVVSVLTAVAKRLQPGRCVT
jgi:hypothetical protein